jgi:tetratricopeptide (TPR) repeat protein
MNAMEKLFSNLRVGAPKSKKTGKNPAKKSKTASLETTVDTRAAVEEVVGEGQDSGVEDAGLEAVEQKQLKSRPRETRPHAFVIMPFGQKKSADGQLIDFNAIYQDLIKPALEEAGFDPFRADEETVSGDILTDMFQELLLADLAVCDMSIDNANVFYELGVRHAMRKRGVIHIQSGRSYMPFDVFNVRTIPYHTGGDGKPDSKHLDKDKQALIRCARDTWASDRDTVHSPIFNLLTGLTEPERKSLRTPLATGFWREYNEWKQRVTVARRQKRIGDILLLTEEISNPLIKEEAIGEAGKALKSMRRHELALQQYRKGLELNPRNMEFRREEALHLNRMGYVDEAIVKLESLLHDEPGDSEAIATLGRIYKDMWGDFWEGVEDNEERLKEAFDASHWLMMSIQTYLKGYYSDLNNYYPGINALTLSIILEHLADKFDEEGDPDIKAIRALLPLLKGSLQFTLEKMAREETSDYWSLVSLAELQVMTGDDPKKVRRAYKKALTAARKNIFNLQSSVAQLEILESLSLRSDFVEIGKKVLNDEINHINKDAAEEEKKPDKLDKEEVFIFKGHKIDLGKKKRFPPEMEEVARQHIDAALDKYHGSDNDLVITAGAACGGDIIFIEACLARGMTVEVYLPFSEPDYIKEEVGPGGNQWVERYYNLRNHPDLTIHIQSDHVGKVKEGHDPYERNNRWALSSSLIMGIDRVRLLVLWDGNTGAAQDRDGRLVSHMVEEMRHIGGFVEHLNTTKFYHPQAGAKNKTVSHDPGAPPGDA